MASFLGQKQILWSKNDEIQGAKKNHAHKRQRDQRAPTIQKGACRIIAKKGAPWVLNEKLVSLVG